MLSGWGEAVTVISTQFLGSLLMELMIISGRHLLGELGCEGAELVRGAATRTSSDPTDCVTLGKSLNCSVFSSFLYDVCIRKIAALA